MPLSRSVALAYGRVTGKPIRSGTRLRARQINELIADGAMRWVYEHPDDDLVSKIELPAERPKWVPELLSVRETPKERRESRSTSGADLLTASGISERSDAGASGAPGQAVRAHGIGTVGSARAADPRLGDQPGCPRAHALQAQVRSRSAPGGHRRTRHARIRRVTRLSAGPVVQDDCRTAKKPESAFAQGLAAEQRDRDDHERHHNLGDGDNLAEQRVEQTDAHGSAQRDNAGDSGPPIRSRVGSDAAAGEPADSPLSSRPGRDGPGRPARRFSTPSYTARVGHWSEMLVDEVAHEVAQRAAAALTAAC